MNTEKLKQAVCNYFFLPDDEFDNVQNEKMTKYAECVNARHCFIWILCYHTNLRQKEIKYMFAKPYNHAIITYVKRKNLSKPCQQILKYYNQIT